MAIEVSVKGIRLNAPAMLSTEQVESSLRRYTEDLLSRWKAVNSAQKTAELHPFPDVPRFVDLFGVRNPVHAKPSSEVPRFSLRQHQDGVTVHGPLSESFEDGLRQVVVSWLKRQAKVDFTQRLELWSRRMNLTFKQLRLKDQKTRWGSCSTLGNINLNWRLVQAPPEIIDYVVIHELAHLHQMNHSPAFWAIVAEYFPEYKAAKKWLKEHGRELHQW